VTFTVTKHAVQRYQERVKPALSVVKAKLELEVLVAQFGHDCLQAIPPPWVAPEAHAGAQSYLLLTDGVAFAVKDGFLITCLVRGGMSEEKRQARLARKEHRQKVRARRASKQSLRHGRPALEDRWSA
jgi:hypothetical protein